MENEINRLRQQIEDLKAQVANLQQRDQEPTYQSLFENSHAVMLLIDPETAAIRDANPAACAYYGWSREELKAFRIENINTLTRDEIFTQMQLAQNEKGRNFFFKHRRADGSVRDVEICSGPLTVKGQTLLHSVVHDITDRVQAQGLLAESERRLSTLMANLPGMAYRCLNDDSWTMKFVSDGCFSLTGYPPSYLLDNHRRNYADLIHPDDRQMVWDKVQAAMDRRKQFNLTYRIHCAGGVEKWVMETGQGIFSEKDNLLAIEGFITDITERKRSEDAHHQSEEKFELAFQASPDSINFNRLSNGVYIDINEGFTKLTGYTREDTIGKSSIDLNIWYDSRDRDRLVKALMSEGYVENFEAKFRKKNGQIGIGLMSARILTMNKEEVILSITREITDRKKTEEALQENLLFLRQTEKIARIGGWKANIDTDELKWTEGVHQIIEAPLDPKPGLESGLNFYDTESIPVIKNALTRALKDGSPFVVQAELVTTTGKRLWAEVRGLQQVVEGGRTSVAGTLQDITERRQTEEALRESEERHRQIVESSTDAILVRSDDCIIYANPAAVKLFRASHPGELLGKRYLDLVHPDERFGSIERIKKSIHESWIAPPREHRLLTIDGQTVHVESTGVPVRYKGETQLFGVFRDITDRKQAEEKLRETEIQYRELAESLPQVIFEVDLNGTLKYVNQTGLKLFGYTLEEIANGFNVLDVFIPEDRERVAHNIIRNIQGQKIGRQDYTAIRKDGTKFPVGAHASPVMSGKTATGLRGILIDLTSTQQAKEEKKKLEIQLQQAQKMEAIGALAGGIAHDFNNILSAIIGYTELAMLNEGAEHCAAELKEALIAANRAKDLVKQILAFSRQTDEERMPVRVARVAREAIKFLRATIPATIEIKTHIDEKSGDVLANSIEIHQIIMNLCTNAQHAIGEKAGLLEIEVQNTDIGLAQKNDLIALQEGSYVRISVKDSGYGMAPDVIGRIFDPYFTTKEKGVGTGLGLAVVHGIVRKSGGAIKVESELGKGTTFHIYLPKADTYAPIKAEAPRPVMGGSERILFVDDEKMLVAVAQKALQHLGYEVVSRTSPLEALELFKAKPNHFDLVITDQTMPGMTGDGLARELMGIRPNLPVIICTGYSQTVDPKRAQQAGIKAFVMKPILINQLADAVRAALE